MRTDVGEMGIVLCLGESGGYHAFTVRLFEGSNDAFLSLWRVESSNDPNRQVIAAVKTFLTPNQWIKLRAKAFQNRIQCYMDNVELIDTPVELPVGGQFGLIASSTNGILFDDIRAQSNHDLDFSGVSDIRRYVLEETGEFLPRRRFFKLLSPKTLKASLQVPKAKKTQHLMLGSIAHGPHVFSADFQPESESYHVGLITAYTGANKPYLVFSCRRSGDKEIFLLERTHADDSSVLEKFALVAKGSGQERINLMSDASTEGELRLYRNNDLVLIHHPNETTAGASGLFVGANTAVKISNPLYSFKRSELYHNKFEKNRLYVEDPFMRHWSSPEGQWLQITNSLIWHKSDFFGRFLVRMPLIDGSEIHFGVPEDSIYGAITLTASTNTGIVLKSGLSAPNDKTKPLSAPIDQLVEESYSVNQEETETQKERWYTVHYESYWIWITSGDKLIIKRSLSSPLKGRRIRLAGFTTEQLKYSYVLRFNVKDYLFTESLHEWMINGGAWDVVNRFTCLPKWSHMNGESADSIAAIWTKYHYEGDFCVEMYAGTRHGWYKRAGDLNITVMNTDTTPSQGYTITCTGWDADNSQLYTRLYRNGRIMAQTDKYLVPRYRTVIDWNDLNARRGYEPLVAPGRPVHGAWYYIKFRKIGKRLEYYYDNELVISFDDDEVFDQGTCGIWTFMNSMMVARVKIAAQKIAPRQFSFEAVDPSSIVFPKDNSTTLLANESARSDNRPLGMMNPEYWTVNDTVGYAKITWHTGKDDLPYFTLRNTLGSGQMLVSCAFAPSLLSKTAGWHFYLKRTPSAEFNCHYSIGTIQNGQYTAQRLFFHRISGTDFSLGSFKMSGETQVNPVPSKDPEWHKEGQWTPVTIWVPAERTFFNPTNNPLYVKFEGVGNLQPSDTLQGLTGNGPGESYAVKNMSEIAYGKSGLALPHGGNQMLFSLYNADNKTIVQKADINTLQKAINSMRLNTLFTGQLQTIYTNRVAQETLAWIEPVSGKISCEWSKIIPSAFVVSSDLDYPDRSFTQAKASVNNMDIQLMPIGTNSFIGLLPRVETLQKTKTPFIEVMIRENSTTNSTYKLSWADSVTNEPPVLLGFKGITPFFENFERRTMNSFDVNNLRESSELETYDAVQGANLRIFNNGKPKRLAANMLSQLELSKYPIFMFRYRGSGLTYVSLMLNAYTRVRLNENFADALSVRYGQDLTIDGQWHTWIGFASDAVAGKVFLLNKLHVETSSFKSLHLHDQTGLFTSWNVDDIVFGPAISDGTQLAFTANYFDFDGIENVMMAVRSGDIPYDQLGADEQRQIKWSVIPNKQEITPPLDGLENGLCFIMLKAVDGASLESRVTEIPFLLDNMPVSTSATFAKNTLPTGNDSILNTTFAINGGAPLDLTSAVFKWNNQAVKPGSFGSSLLYTSNTVSMSLNWPYVFRNYLDQSTDGQTNIIAISGIKDGAGNKATDVIVSIVNNYAADTVPPTLMPTKMPTNVLWRPAWEVPSESSTYFASRNTKLAIARQADEEAYLLITPSSKNSSIKYNLPQKQKWQVGIHPYLAFRINRPTITNDLEQIDLILTSPKENKAFIVPLTHPRNGPHVLNLPEPISWRSNVWYSVFLDLRELIKNKFKESSLEEIVKKSIDEENMPIGTDTEEDRMDMLLRYLCIDSIGFQTKSDDSYASAFMLQSVIIFDNWRPADTIKLTAFDASGIGGSLWELEKNSATTDISPISLASTNEGLGWIILRVKDKAGNISTPVRFPIPGSSDEQNRKRQ
ncbi:MAG: hypothetical protein JXN60_04225 [Lentisphaerae bacterium]|nr:hypothetical protein [Lentisphaerota bacterium]